MSASNLCIPIKLDAFVLNKDTCSGGTRDVKIAPITQPNYTFLRIDKGLLQNDVVDHVDIHNASPAEKNNRVTDLGTGKTRENRLGVYLHWIVPRPYRSGNASSPERKDEKRSSKSTAADNQNKDDHTAPKLGEPPNRWLIIRRIDPNTAKPPGKIPKTQAWVIESDRIRYIDQLDQKCDLEVDVSPFVTSTAKLADPENKNAPIDGINLSQQAETFIGYKREFESWLKEDQKFDRGEKKDAPERVRLSLLNSSNQLFPDYQPHNSNVFSMIDNFSYRDEDQEDENNSYLMAADAEYYVLGWHSDIADGLLAKDSLRETALKNIAIKLNDVENDTIKNWLGENASAGTICHGAMYQVKWRRSWSQKADRPSVPGDTFTNHLTKKLAPVGIGNTSLDSMLAYISAQGDTDLEKRLKTLGPLLRAQSDSLSDQQAGQDEVQNYNFMQFPGGTRYVFPGDSKEPAKSPYPEKLETLRKLNDAQCLLDAARRIYQKKQWELFSIWWKFVTSANLEDSQSPDRIEYTKQRNEIMDSLKDLEDIMEREEGEIRIKLDLFGNEIQASALPEFVQLRDPTIFIAGTQSGWPTDYLDELRCRIDEQITTYHPPKPTDNKPPFLACLPPQFQNTANLLLDEFLSYSPIGQGFTVVGDSKVPTYPPLYHDRGDPDDKINPDPNAPWRDSWSDTQAWFPLFVEFEAEYFHVDFEKWQLNDSTARLNNKQLLRYGIRPDRILYDDKRVDKDRRIISGRILLLPQPTFSLATELTLLFSSISKEEVKKHIGDQDEKTFIAKVKNLPFLSFPMIGFSNHMVTVSSGSHLKPNARVPGKAPVPIKEAFAKTGGQGGIRIGADEILKMGLETDITPYATLVGLPETDITAFKPVTHGQFRFTRLNIIDKFGQCADAIDQTPQAKGTPPLFSCLSDYYQPQVIPDTDPKANFPNIPKLQKSPDECEFAQIPPQINQSSRLNAAFVVANDDRIIEDYWRPVNEWENPIWGWAVVNYVNNGLQFFLADGTFYREVRVAAPNAPVVPLSRQWLPIKSTRKSPKSPKQLDELIAKLTDANSGQSYLTKFIEMATKSVDNSNDTPQAYSQFTNSLVGRPLALVNAAVSIELSSDENKCQSEMRQEKILRPIRNILGDPNGKENEDENSRYTFKIKLGEQRSGGDGLVGYFRNKKASPEDIDLDLIYTYFTAPNKVYQPIQESTFPKVLPYWISPERSNDKRNNEEAGAYFQAERNTKLSRNVFSLIMDPFLSTHLYSSVLPVTPLKLPEWTWQSALKSMTTFFHMGPVIVPSDVPKFDPLQELTDEYTLRKDANGKTKDFTYKGVGDSVAIPALKMAEWSWLQPYRNNPKPRESKDDNPNADDPDPSKTIGELSYMALPLGVMDSKPRFENGPYTVIEGYLQMKRPI
ncbi:hypothetical protein B0J11DRAFT_473640, partial [Dendryphion nanum]